MTPSPEASDSIGISSTYSNSFIPGTLWPMQVTAFFSSSAGDHRATGPKHLHTTQLQCGPVSPCFTMFHHVSPCFTIAICTPNLLALNVNLKGILTYTYSIHLYSIFLHFGAKKTPYINIINGPFTIHGSSFKVSAFSCIMNAEPSVALVASTEVKRAMFSVAKFSWGARNLSRLVSCAKPHPGRILGAAERLWTMALKSSINHIKHGEG